MILDYLRYALYNRDRDRTVPFSSLSRNSKSRRFTRFTRGRKGTFLTNGTKIAITIRKIMLFDVRGSPYLIERAGRARQVEFRLLAYANSLQGSHIGFPLPQLLHFRSLHLNYSIIKIRRI